MISTDGLLQKQYIHWLQPGIVLAPYSIISKICHEFQNSKGHQGTICTFRAIRRFYWWPKLYQDIKYINKYDICAKHLPNMAKYLQKHLEIPWVPVAVLVMANIGCLPVTCRKHQLALTAVCMHMSYVFAKPLKEKSAENFQAYISGIFTHKGGSITIFSDNDTELKMQFSLMHVNNLAQRDFPKSISSTRELKNWECTVFLRKSSLNP